MATAAKLGSMEFLWRRWRQARPTWAMFSAALLRSICFVNHHVSAFDPLHDFLGSGVPVVHMIGSGLIGGRIANSSGIFFWVWTLIALQVTETPSAVIQRWTTAQAFVAQVPSHQLGWRPHEKARTLGELALHIATVPGAVAELVGTHSTVQPPQFIDPKPKGASELIPALDNSVAKAKQVLGGMDDAALTATWRKMNGERELFALPRVAVLRSLMLNHWYHDRGQLTVYLRELDVSIPSIYGPSADENHLHSTMMPVLSG